MSLARITPIVGSLYSLFRNKLGLNVATALGSQELSVTSAPDRRLVVLGHTPIAGFEQCFEVSDEAAMLALHTLDSTTLLAKPTFVAPGDSCLRADDPGWRWHCISGHGTTLADWERRPLAGALSEMSSGIAGAQPLDADLTAIAAQGVSAWGLTRMADSGATDAKNALSITRADIGDASAVGRNLMAVATPSVPSVHVAAADGSVTATPVSGLGGTTITFTPGPLIGSEISYQWAANGDTNGVLYAIGVLAGNGTWTNPATAGAVVVTLIGGWDGGSLPEWEVDRSTSHSYQAAWQLGNGIQVDLGAGRSLRPSKYSMRNYSGSDRYARNWQFCGSNDGTTWTALDTRTGDSTMGGGTYAWGTYSLTMPSIGYRYFRWLTTGNDSNGDQNFATNEIELYGAAILSAMQPPTGYTGWATDGDGHYWPYR